jgi:hypothetical protein
MALLWEIIQAKPLKHFWMYILALLWEIIVAKALQSWM